jgi:hypothetical protein
LDCLPLKKCVFDQKLNLSLGVLASDPNLKKENV